VDAWDHRAGREDAAAQADYDGALWDAIAAERAVCVGGTVMAYSDEWWKAGDPQRQQPGGFPNPFFPDGQMDESYFGVVAVSRDPAGGADRIMPRAAYHALAARWGAP
jgi:hypothetical protein